MHTLFQAYRTVKQAAARGPQPALAIHMVPELQGEMDVSMSISQPYCSLTSILETIPFLSVTSTAWSDSHLPAWLTARTVNLARTPGERNIETQSATTAQELSRVKQELEEKNAQLQLFNEISSWGKPTSIGSQVTHRRQLASTGAAPDAREPSRVPLRAQTRTLISNRRPVMCSATLGVRCRLCACVCGISLVVACFSCCALCDFMVSSLERKDTAAVDSGSGRTANAPESPTKAIRRWWDQSWREGVTRSVIDRAHKETALVKGREESNDPIFLIQNGAASRSSSISSGELLRQGVCSRCASAWFVWDSARVVSRSLLQSSMISPREVDLGTSSQ